MKVSLKTRSLAYLVDIIIIISLSFLIELFLPVSNKQLLIEENISKLSESYLREEISFTSYIEEYSILSNQLGRENVVIYIIYFVLIFIYFNIIPLWFSGKTIGKYILRIKIENTKPLFVTLLIRNLLINGIGFFILLLLCLYLVPDKFYLFSVSILSIIQILLVIRSVFMIKYRNDKRSLEDILSYSKVVLEG